MPKPWADQPFALISTPTASETKGLSPGTIKVASEMCLAHNLLTRWLNAIYLQAPHVKSPTDVSDFITYAQVWHESIHHHHAMEEEYFFPWIETYSGEKGIMDKNVEQHEAFHKGLERFGEYVHKVKVEEYDGMKLRGIVDGFGHALTLHLREEIKTLIGLERFGGEKLSKVWGDLEKKVRTEIKDKSRQPAGGLGAIDRSFEGGKFKKWPPFPWFVPYLVYLWFGRKYKGSWRFSPCTYWGVPRELPFAKEEESV